MQDKKVLVVGCGKVGGRVAETLTQDFQVYGLRRTRQANTNALQYIQSDVCDKTQLRIALEHHLPEGIDYLVYCLTPSERTEQGYRESYVEGLANVIDSLPNSSRLTRIIFVSSSSVYHQNDDSWIDELSPCEPSSFSGKLILEAENLLRQSGLPGTVVRFSGIYGGNRRQLINQVKKSAEENTPVLSDTLRRSNRIHEDDCVGFIVHLIRRAEEGNELAPLYLASDDAPVDLNEVILWLAEQLSLNINQDMSEQAKRRSGNKKCSNKKMTESGYQLIYSSFKEGYNAMLSN